MSGETGDAVKIQRSNKANPKERFSGFLDKENMEWLRQMADQDERSVASMLNRIVRKYREEGEANATSL